MAVICGSYLYKDYEVLLLLDPNRWRVTIWKRLPGAVYHTIKARRMHDKDKERILRRAEEWINKTVESTQNEPLRCPISDRAG